MLGDVSPVFSVAHYWPGRSEATKIPRYSTVITSKGESVVLVPKPSSVLPKRRSDRGSEVSRPGDCASFFESIQRSSAPEYARM